MRKKILTLGFFVAVGFLLAGAAIYYIRSTQYKIIHPAKGDITEAVYGLGKVKSSNRFEVIVGVISNVTERFVNEGDFVQKGAPLIRLGDSALFRAPFAGTVTYANLYKGETAVPHVPVLRLEDLTHRYIELSLEQQSILRMKVNQPAKISFESLRGKVLQGKVAAIFPRADEFIARISIEDLDPGILPGMTADVTVEIGSIHDVLLLPVAAISNGQVSVRKDGRWQKVKVEVGHIDGLSAEIKGDTLSTSDEVRMKAGI